MNATKQPGGRDRNESCPSTHPAGVTGVRLQMRSPRTLRSGVQLARRSIRRRTSTRRAAGTAAWPGSAARHRQRPAGPRRGEQLRRQGTGAAGTIRSTVLSRSSGSASGVSAMGPRLTFGVLGCGCNALSTSGRRRDVSTAATTTSGRSTLITLIMEPRTATSRDWFSCAPPRPAFARSSRSAFLVALVATARSHSYSGHVRGAPRRSCRPLGGDASNFRIGTTPSNSPGGAPTAGGAVGLAALTGTMSED